PSWAPELGYYPLAGLAHKVIFAGFLILLLRTLILWGRGFDPAFNFGILGEHPATLPVLGAVPIGRIYEFTKDVFASLVLAGASVFVYFRVIRHEPRMTLSNEGLLILGIIMAMMLGDMIYDGASMALWHKQASLNCAASLETCARVQTLVAHYGGALPTHAEELQWSLSPSPAGSLFAVMLSGLDAPTLVVLGHVGFWVHSTLVLVFLNLLPHSKHFHIITAIPNVFTRELGAPGRLPFMGNAEQIGEKVGALSENPDTAEPVGVSRIEHFTWKAILDFYTCTECGRCSDNCPAHKTGKILSPKQLTLDLRDHLYGRENEFVNRPGGPKGEVDEHSHAQDDDHAHGDDHAQDDDHAHGDDHGHHEPVYPDNPIPVPDVVSKPVELVGGIIHPDVLWACTTCRACEEQCPVMISYVDKIVGMRRNLVMVRGEFPAELNGPFQAMEVNGNPWNLARIDRGGWADGLGVPTMAEHPGAPVLYWVGCAASYDDRAKKIARATAKLMKAAGVDFAILGQEETCTGDPARRAGNEYLFAMLAEQNVTTLNGYKEQGGVKQIITTCPHCFNTLKNEYPDFGGKFEVVHHTDFLLGLLAEGKLHPTRGVRSKVAYHDSCYLGRYNGVYESPREILKSIPGIELVEAEWSREKGLCCGAGGAQMWMEEQNSDRVNNRRTLQLLNTGADTIASACPFCHTMLTDGIKSFEDEPELKNRTVEQLDIAVILERSCGLAPSRSSAQSAPVESDGEAAATASAEA
ncbi:MAG TPA: heterodisulfide reductase-related iron-sulfur binding cluster, partial [Polyangiaceae bacterium]